MAPSHLYFHTTGSLSFPNRRMQFKVGNYRDGDKKSNLRMLTGAIKADLTVSCCPSSLSHAAIRQKKVSCCPSHIETGCHAGVFRNKGAAPCAITRAEKLQLSVFLPNDLSSMVGMQEFTPCPAVSIRSAGAVYATSGE